MTKIVTLIIIVILFTPLYLQADTKDPKIIANEKYNAGIIAFNKEYFGKAKDHFYEAYNISRNATTAYMIGVCCMKLDLPGSAITYMQLALAGDPPLDESLRKDAKDVLKWAHQKQDNRFYKFKGIIRPKESPED